MVRDRDGVLRVLQIGAHERGRGSGGDAPSVHRIRVARDRCVCGELRLLALGAVAGGVGRCRRAGRRAELVSRRAWADRVPLRGAVTLAIHGEDVLCVQNDNGRPRFATFATGPVVGSAAPAPETTDAAVSAGLTAGCAWADGHVFCPDRSGAVHRARPDGSEDHVVASSRSGSRVAAARLASQKVGLAYLASRKTSEGWVSEASIAVDDETPVRLSEDGSGATSVTLADYAKGALAVTVDARTALTVMHVRSIVHDGHVDAGRGHGRLRRRTGRLTYWRRAGRRLRGLGLVAAADSQGCGKLRAGSRPHRRARPRRRASRLVHVPQRARPSTDRRGHQREHDVGGSSPTAVVAGRGAAGPSARPIDPTGPGLCAIEYRPTGAPPTSRSRSTRAVRFGWVGSIRPELGSSASCVADVAPCAAPSELAERRRVVSKSEAWPHSPRTRARITTSSPKSTRFHRRPNRPDGYHALIDDLEVDLRSALRARGDVLECGAGTGLLLERIAGFARSARGIDMSPRMLERARARDLDVTEASVTEIPFADASFDVTCSFKVLAHVPEIGRALAEMARVTRPGGAVIAEFYNPMSPAGSGQAFGSGRRHLAKDPRERRVYAVRPPLGRSALAAAELAAGSVARSSHRDTFRCMVARACRARRDASPRVAAGRYEGRLVRGFYVADTEKVLDLTPSKRVAGRVAATAHRGLGIGRQSSCSTFTATWPSPVCVPRSSLLLAPWPMSVPT